MRRIIARASLSSASTLSLTPLVTSWVQVKLALLPLYVLLGLLLFQYARKRHVRAFWYFAAVTCYGFVVSVALTQSPLGVLRWTRF